MKLLASRYEKSFYIEALTESHNVISNSFLTLDIEGACDSALMQQAMHHVFSHPEFHVRYELQGEHLYKFANRQEYTIPLIDLTTQRDPESAFQQLLTTYYSEKLTFGDSLLFKACLCQIAPAHHRAIIMVHHICLDGTGFQRFFDELTQSYGRLRRGETLAPIAAPLAQEQAPPLSDALQQEALAFWTRALDGQPVRTDFNHAINSEQRRACTEKCALGTELSQRVKAYCRRSGLTPNLFFKGLYALLVGRMANQRMIAISSPMDRRSKAMRRQLGCFVNTRLDLFDLRSIATLSAYWAQIRQFNKATKPYAELPYAQLVHALQKQSPDPGAMLSNVVFGSTVGIGETYPLDAQCRIAQDYRFIDLNADLQLLFCESSQHSFNFRFDYLQGFQPCGLFTGFLARFQRLIEWALAQDDGEMAQMPFLGRAELDRLTQLNQRRQPYPDDSLAQRVHRWVQETPAATALIDSEHNQAIGYAQLHERVSAIAHYLSTLTPADHRGQGCVVINLTSLVDTVVAILATQYCGLAFTCVDASAPMARKQLIMEQLSPLLLIGDAIPGAQASHTHHLAALEHIPPAPGRYLPHAGAAEQISQYIFTSGTTGQPKAVALTHRALVSTLYQNDAIPVGERLLYSANEAFDAASLQLWLALLHGRTLVIPSGAISPTHTP
ncbi:condensation domain-containing protein [Edwardsiella anguillarum]|nr:condensation domain-containing protein [Edwardsiella anguillarum]